LEYLFVTWERLEELTAGLSGAIRERQFEPDIIVGVSRGGLVPTRLLSDFLDVRDVIVLGVAFYEDLGKTASEPRITHPLTRDIRGKRVILSDDVSDTGGSLALARSHVLSFRPADLLVCTLHRKPWSTFHPDLFVEETDKWIIYPWEKAEATEHIIRKGGRQGVCANLQEAGFSEADLGLLGDLKVLGPNPLGSDGDKDEGE
jgi:hypoxanthine phosphoribosyltransferase